MSREPFEGYELCPRCQGDGTVSPAPGAVGRPWCRTCLGTGLLAPSGRREG